MRVLLLDNQNAIGDELQEMTCRTIDLSIIKAEFDTSGPADYSGIEAVIGVGSSSNGRKVTEQLLIWRTDPYTYLVPCWVGENSVSFEKFCLWPRLSIDCIEDSMDSAAVLEWLLKLSDWQQSRMHLPSSDSLTHRSTLEIITSLALRRASGKLLFFNEEGTEGSMILEEGCLADAILGHLRGEEVISEFLAWSRGSYFWERRHAVRARTGLPLSLLLHEGLALFRDANYLYHFLSDFDCPILKTQSQSALDDPAVPYYNGLQELYRLIDGKLSASELLQASPLSRPRTMAALARWFSLQDVSFAPKGISRPKEPEPVPIQDVSVPTRRLLIVDDSRFMCRALESIFKQDSRFELVGEAHDGIEALSLIEELKPDVVTLDIQMPRMDGLTALKHIMIRNPTPVVVLSSFTMETSRLTYESFKYGAISVFAKPSRLGSQRMDQEVEQLAEAVWQAAGVQMESVRYIRRSSKGGKDKPVRNEMTGGSSSAGSDTIPLAAICCGAGGFPSFLKLLLSITQVDHLPIMVVCMAMPRVVVESLVPNLDGDCAVKVEKLDPGTDLQCGVCYLYSYEDCLHLSTSDGQVKMVEGSGCEGHLHAFDHLFCSLADSFTGRAVAIMISGKGSDGLEGMQVVQRNGGETLVLSPGVCLNPDLPRDVLARGYAREIKTTGHLATLLERYRDLVGQGSPATAVEP
jgi:two-component system chemotaxis response regulator CheB